MDVIARCTNRKCETNKIYTERIFDTLEMKQTDLYSRNQKKDSKIFICYNCEQKIDPQIYCKLSPKKNALSTTKVKLLHFLDLRKQLEDEILMIDNGYRRMHKQ